MKARAREVTPGQAEIQRRDPKSDTKEVAEDGDEGFRQAGEVPPLEDDLRRRKPISFRKRGRKGEEGKAEKTPKERCPLNFGSVASVGRKSERERESRRLPQRSQDPSILTMRRLRIPLSPLPASPCLAR